MKCLQRFVPLSRFSTSQRGNPMPDLRLPSQPQSVTAPWAVTNYTAWWQRHMGVNNLHRVAARQCTGRESNLQPLNRESNTLTTTLPSHRHQSPCHQWYWNYGKWLQRYQRRALVSDVVIRRAAVLTELWHKHKVHDASIESIDRVDKLWTQTPTICGEVEQSDFLETESTR